MTDESIMALNSLLEKNKQFVDEYRSSALMCLISSSDIEKEDFRERMLDAIQTLSNYFQKIVLLRLVLTDHHHFSTLALEHLKEEFCHHEALMTERNYRVPLWDPILESTCSWFLWRMFNTNDEEKIVLIHLVLEASANAFFQHAYPVMRQYTQGNYFKEHAGADEKHEKMGEELLKGLSLAAYQRLSEIQYQAWSVMLAACNRIAELSLGKVNGGFAQPSQAILIEAQ